MSRGGVRHPAFVCQGNGNHNHVALQQDVCIVVPIKSKPRRKGPAMTAPLTTAAATAARDAILATGYTPTPGYNGWTDPAAKAFRAALRAADYAIAATLAPSADVLAKAPTAATVKAYPDYYIVGPGRKIADATLCSHGYRLTDSCPGCDYDQDYGIGPFAK